MSQIFSLKEAERKAFTSTLDDGVVDIVIGAFLLIFVIAPFLSDAGLGDFWSSFVFLPYNALVLLAAFIVKRLVVAPRLGTVKFGPARQARLRKSLWILLAILLVGFGLGTLSFLSGTGPWVGTARFGMIVLVGFSTAAYFMDCRRLYLYGLMVSLGLIAAEALYVVLGAAHYELPIALRLISRVITTHHGFPFTFGIVCSIMTVNGLRLFVGFLSSHPLPPDEPLPGEASNG